MSVKLHIYLSSLKYISLDVTANARFLKSKHIRHIYLLMAVIYFVLFIAYIIFFSHFILYDNAFYFFSANGCFILRDVQRRRKMKFETRAFNKDVEQKE
jgi:hypothetical protein